jgi:hypothetical protein
VRNEQKGGAMYPLEPREPPFGDFGARVRVVDDVPVQASAAPLDVERRYRADMRVLVALIALGCVGSAAGAAATTELRIRVWPEGRPGASKTWTLECSPIGGTLPARGRACGALASLRDPFAPVPKDMACSEIYGGPQVALVTGTFRGRRTWALFRRRDGCEVARWNGVKELFPVPLQPA